MHCKDTILRTQNNWPYSKFIPNSGYTENGNDAKAYTKAIWPEDIEVTQKNKE